MNLDDPIHAALLCIIMAAIEDPEHFSPGAVLLMLEGLDLGEVKELATELIRDEALMDEEALDDPEPEEE